MNGAGPEGPLSVAFVSPGWPVDAFPNGVVTSIATLAPELRRAGLGVHVLAGRVAGREGGRPAPDAEAEAEGVVDLERLAGVRGPLGRLADRIGGRIDPGGAAERRRCRPILRAARSLAGGPGGHVLEMEEAFGWPRLVGPRCPMPVVVRLHGPWFLNGPNNGADPESPEFARRVRREGLGIAAADAVTAPSRDVLERTRAHYGLSLEGAEVIPNATAPVPGDRRWRPEGVEADRVLFVGRFDLHKGGDTLIDAFALVSRDRPTARLTFVGPDRGLVRDGRRWRLEEYVEHRMPGALRDGRVEWLGRRPHSELEGLRRRAAVTVVASRYETFAITIGEALAAGCPLVATRAGGAGELFEHGAHGLYAEPADPAGLAAAIGSLLADPARAAALGRAAARHCERTYAPEVVAARMIRFYRRVAAGRRRRPARGLGPGSGGREARS